MSLSMLEDLDYTDRYSSVTTTLKCTLTITHIDKFRRKRIGLTPLGNRLDCVAINCDKSRVMYIGNRVVEPEFLGSTT